MEKYVLENWRWNVARLAERYDAAGVNWNRVDGIPHFPGNFFCARAEYIGSLQSFGDYRKAFLEKNETFEERNVAEFWLGPTFAVR